MSPIVETYKQLRAMPLDQLVELYDGSAKHTDFGLGFIREEIARRDAEVQTEQMIVLTRQILWLSAVMTLLTVVNVMVVVVALFGN